MLSFGSILVLSTCLSIESSSANKMQQESRRCPASKGQHILLQTRMNRSHSKLPQASQVNSFTGPGDVFRYNFSSKYVGERDVLVWLPAGYHNGGRYAVLYMQDGQTAFSGLSEKSFEVDKHITKLGAEVIVVAPYHGGIRRMAEFAPASVVEGLRFEDRRRLLDSGAPNGRLYPDGDIYSDDYLHFLLDEIKPFIDKTYRTKADKSNTFVLGSSMGGLLSLYGIMKNPDVFGGVICMSPFWPLTIGDEFLDGSIWPDTLKQAYDEVLSKNLPSSGTSRLWIDRGTMTLDQYLQPYDSMIERALLARDLKAGHDYIFHVYQGASHDEEAWSARLPEALKFIFRLRVE